MIAAGSGLSISGSPVEAALEACLAAQERSGADRADLCVVFVTPEAHRAAGEVLHAVRRVTGAPAVVGCSAVGVLTDRMEFEPALLGRAGRESAVAVLSVRAPDLRAAPFLVEGREGLGAATGATVGAQGASDAVFLILPDPQGLDPAALLGGIASRGSASPVVGAVASGPPLFELCNATVAQGALAGAALGGMLPVVGVAQGCEPIGEPFVVTRAEGGVVHQIAGRPALDVLEEAIAGLDDAERRVETAGIFAGLAMDPAKSPLGRGDFLVRALLGADRDTGAVAVGEPVRVGQTIQFQIRDAEAARSDLEEMLQGVTQTLGGRRPAFGLYFDCAGRGAGLYGVADHDIGLIRERLGEFPLAGFFGNGEFAPVGARNHFHTYTGVLVVYPQADVPAGQTRTLEGAP